MLQVEYAKHSQISPITLSNGNNRGKRTKERQSMKFTNLLEGRELPRILQNIQELPMMHCSRLAAFHN